MRFLATTISLLGGLLQTCRAAELDPRTAEALQPSSFLQKLKSNDLNQARKDLQKQAEGYIKIAKAYDDEAMADLKLARQLSAQDINIQKSIPKGVDRNDRAFPHAEANQKPEATGTVGHPHIKLNGPSSGPALYRCNGVIQCGSDKTHSHPFDVAGLCQPGAVGTRLKGTGAPIQVSNPGGLDDSFLDDRGARQRCGAGLCAFHETGELLSIEDLRCYKIAGSDSRSRFLGLGSVPHKRYTCDGHASCTSQSSQVTYEVDADSVCNDVLAPGPPGAMRDCVKRACAHYDGVKDTNTVKCWEKE
uniref:Uncharacterized protein n=1 Tax=Chromera velia CCMP2878 TaxID=1169474 RepID=A0A0G4FQR6_9ALVE|eukprot:Cvel_18214.t1-p1 / transcript=Cvel_18214.t1 / gene=Cvel_18214 / organism=Chromera_velia_CCMP2878 / gene_product=hypothetical protein / transcript_product=hypothetical protein / location=Cvel_scaffold1496:24363-26159(-) / protein_length=303 / sequence_SO=supercontig / SO=protein_coding / is_pseudo=false